MFVETLMFHFQDQRKLSLSDLCNDIHFNYGIDIKKQSLDQRFGKSATAFLKSLLEKSFAKFYTEDHKLGIFKKFKKVKVKDSTSFELPENMKGSYPGNSGFSSDAGMSIQFEYDLKTNATTEIGLFPKTVNDHTNARKTISEVKEGELLVRDLGYVSVDILKKIDEKGAYYLNRIKTQTAMYQKANGEYKTISAKSITKKMRKGGMAFLEQPIYIGSRKYQPCRAVFILIPDDKVRERKKRQLRKSRRRGGGDKIDTSVLEWLNLNVFITNTKPEDVPASEVYNIYKLRWQIELVFKTWKQICRINTLKQVKPARTETIIYAQLLWITLNWSIINLFLGYYFRNGHGLLSVFKAFKTMKMVAQKLRDVIKKDKKLILLLEELGRVLGRNHFREKRKNREFSEDILLAFKQ